MSTSRADDARKAFQWHPSPTDGVLVRQLTGTEESIYRRTVNNAHGYPDFYMIHSVLIKLEAPLASSQLSQLICQAWKSLYLRISHLSTLVTQSQQESSPIFTYRNTVNETEKELWTASTYRKHLATLSEYGLESILQDVTAIVTQSPCEFNTSSHGFLDATLLEDSIGGHVPMVVLTLRTSHLCFDGTGAWNLFHALLQALADGTRTSQGKSSPDPSLGYYINPEILNSDHSELIESQVESLLFNDGHHFCDSTAETGDPSPCMGISKQRLSKEATKSILQRSKRLGVTVSQLINACFIIALLKEYPADRNGYIFYDSPINIRDLIPLPQPWYGNAVDVTYNVVKCDTLTDNLLRGQVSDVKDATAVYNLSQRLTANAVSHKSNAVTETLCLMTSFAEAAKRREAASQKGNGSVPSPTPPTPALVCTSDGLLDRNLSTTYRGDDLNFNVLEADVVLRRTTPLVSSRTYTFDGRLTLLLTFTPGAWAQSKVDSILFSLLANLEYVLDSVESVTQP